jgi:hypothetical protein
MRASERFFLDDSSSSYESDIKQMILDDNIEKTLVIVAVKNLQVHMVKKRRRDWSPAVFASLETAPSATPL